MSNNLPRDKGGKFVPFAWPGGYDIAYYFDDGTALCAACADKAEENEEPPTMAGGMQDSDSCETCEDCGRSLSAYCRVEDDGAVDHSEYCSNHPAPPHEPLTWRSSLCGFSLTMERSQAESVSGPGPADENVVVLVREPLIAAQLDAIDPESIRRELRESGAWDAEELTDDAANRKRLVWVAGCDLREEDRQS